MRSRVVVTRKIAPDGGRKTAKPGKLRGENFERFQAMKDDSILPTALQEKNIEAKINI